MKQHDMEQPKVSIIIPCYNSEAFLGETLQSCINQLYPNVEIVIVDDGSTDGSLQIARQWESRHRNIHVYAQPNSGACRARNLALKKCTGDYIMYLDADDLITPDKISSQMELLKDMHDTMAIATSRFEEFVDKLPENIHCRVNYKDYSNPIDLLIDIWSTGGMFPVSCYLISRKMAETVGSWDERLLKNQDGDYFSRVLMSASRVYFCDKGFFFYRRGHASQSTVKINSEPKLRSVLLTHQKQKNILKIEDSPRVRKALARNFSLVLNSAKFGSELYHEALKEIEALGQKPQIINPSPLVRIFTSLFGTVFFLRLKSWIK